MADEKKIWIVNQRVYTDRLEACLNALADDGYTIHSIHTDEDREFWVVLAYDAARIMEKSTAAMVKQMTDLQGLPPGGK